MSKWINVDAFVADARMVGLDTAEEVFFALAHQPGIDIVRCKECRHRPIKEDADGEDYDFNIIAPNEAELCPCLVDDSWYSWMPEDDFYCGYGEREGE